MSLRAYGGASLERSAALVVSCLALFAEGGMRRSL